MSVWNKSIKLVFLECFAWVWCMHNVVFVFEQGQIYTEWANACRSWGTRTQKFVLEVNTKEIAWCCLFPAFKRSSAFAWCVYGEWFQLVTVRNKDQTISTQCGHECNSNTLHRLQSQWHRQPYGNVWANGPDACAQTHFPKRYRQGTHIRCTHST